MTMFGYPFGVIFSGLSVDIFNPCESYSAETQLTSAFCNGEFCLVAKTIAATLRIHSLCF